MGSGNLEETPKVEWTRVENVGWKYTAPRPDNSPPFTLVVFVHGFRGHSRKTWKEMPAKCLAEYHKRKRETANVDLAAYSYPAGLLHDADLESASLELQNWLTSDAFPQQAQLIFVAHSTGGLVVKHMLRKNFEEHKDVIFDVKRQQPLSACLWLRTRRVVNVAVPHRGANERFSNLGRKWYPRLFWLAKPTYGVVYKLLTFVGRKFGRNPRRFGFNNFVPLLENSNPELDTLEAEYQQHVGESKQKYRPHPQRSEFYASSDNVIAPGKKKRSLVDEIDLHLSANEIMTLRADHVSIKNVDSTYLRERIGRELEAVTELGVAAATLQQVPALNLDDGVRELEDKVAPGAEPTLHVANLKSGSQREAFEWLTRVSQEAEGPSLKIVTGVPFAGKTALLRELAMEISWRYLCKRAPGQEQPLQIFIPLHLVALKTDKQRSRFRDVFDNPRFTWDSAPGEWPERAFELLLGWWVGWATSIVKVPVTMSWLENRLQNQPSVLILDGAQDFIHPLEIGQIRCLIAHILEKYSTNPRLCVVLSMPSNTGGLADLATHLEASVFENLPRPIPEELRAWYAEIKDKTLQGVAHVLIDRSLISAGDPPKPTLGAIMRKALRKLLTRRGLPKPVSIDSVLELEYPAGSETLQRGLEEIRNRRRAERRDQILEVHWEHALQLAARIFYWGQHKEMTEDAVQEEAWNATRRWYAHLKNGAKGFDDLLIGYALLLNKQTLGALLRKTVFLLSLGTKWRFKPTEWIDYLVAGYVSESIRWDFVQELGQRAFQSSIYSLAAARVKDIAITDEKVQCMLKAAPLVKLQVGDLDAGASFAGLELSDPEARERRRFILANLFTIIGNSKMEIAGTALGRLLDAAKSDDGVRYIALATLCYRCFADPPNSVGIRQAVRPILKAELERTDGNAVLKSLAWCYRKAFSLQQVHGSVVDLPQPELESDNKQHLKDALAILAPEARFTSRYHTVQNGFLRYLDYAATEPKRAITAVHYAFCLVAIVKKRLAIEGLSNKLARALRSDSDFCQTILAQRHPGVNEILSQCQQGVRIPAEENEVDLRSAEFSSDPYPALTELREESPIFWSAALGNWVLTRYEDVRYVLEHRDAFSSSRKTSGLPETTNPDLKPLRRHLAKWMLHLDKQEHSRFSQWIGDVFTPDVAHAFEPRIRKIADELIRKVVDTGQMDIIHDLAWPLSLRVIAELLGIPPKIALLRRLKKYCDDIVHYIGTREGATTAQESLEELQRYFLPLIMQRKKSPENDLITGLVKALEDSRRLDDEDILAVSVMMLTGGHETVTNLIGNGILALLQNRNQFELLLEARARGNSPDHLQRYRSLVRNTARELLRYDSPIQRVARVAEFDIQIGGKWIGKGQRILLFLGAANRDPRVFGDDADKLDITRRTDTKNLAFGSGVHGCLGAGLGITEAKIAFETLLEHVENLQLGVAKPEWSENPAFRGLRRLPVTFEKRVSQPEPHLDEHDDVDSAESMGNSP